MSELKTIAVEVAYALPTRQKIIALNVEDGTTALKAAHLSGIGLLFPDLKIDDCKMGIFSKVLDGKQQPTPDEYVLKAGDRVELYRPLLVDPKAARAARAAKAKAKKEQAKGA